MISKLEEFSLLMAMVNKYMPSEYGADIFHYTSPIGFHSILFGDTGKITLWASRYDCLNDVSEGTVAETVYQEVCKTLKEKNEISEEMYDLFSKIKPARTIFLGYYEGDKYKITRSECDRFICSFSKNPDSLTMWNYYSKGNKYEGYNIGLLPYEVRASLKTNFRDKEIAIHIYPVIYKKEEQINLISSLLKKLQALYEKEYESSIRYTISNQLLNWSLIFKSEYFQHEEEVRVIVDVAKRTKDGLLQKMPIDIKYRNNYGYIIPYIELKIEKYALSYACVGPLQCDAKQKETQKCVLTEMLNANGYAAKEAYSKIPVRF